MRNGLFIAAMALAAVASQGALAGEIQLLDAADYGESWPFTVEEMHLLCLPGRAVVVSDPESGRMYPLNGAASGKAAKLALEPLAPIWRGDPALPGAKVGLGPLIARGLELCR
jgi:hypothetical protein